MKRYIVCAACGAILFTGCYAAPYKEYTQAILKSNESVAVANQAYYQYLIEVARANAARDHQRLILQAEANSRPLVEMIPDGKGGFITKVNRQSSDLQVAQDVVSTPPTGFIKPTPPEMESKVAVDLGKTLIWGGAAAYGLHGLLDTMKAVATPSQANVSNVTNTTAVSDSGNSVTENKTVSVTKSDNDTSTVNTTEDNDVTKTSTSTTESNPVVTVSDSFNTQTQTATSSDNDTTTVTKTDEKTTTNTTTTEENGDDNNTITGQPIEPVGDSGGTTGTN